MDKNKLFGEIRTYCNDLRSKHAERDTQALGMEDMYLMRKTAHDEALEAISPDVVLTKSTDERVAIQGVLRLLTTTVPAITMPRDKNDLSNMDASDDIERLGNALLASSDKTTLKPLHYNATLCGSLYDEIHIQIVCTADLVEAAKGGSPAAVARAERVAALSPYQFIALNPKSGYPVWDSLGLQAYHRQTVVTMGQVVDQYGKAVEDLITSSGKTIDETRLKEATLYDYWDTTYRCTWIDGYDRPIMVEEHGLPFIPIVASIAEGSDLFDSAEDRREPFLLTVFKSKLDQRKTEALTAMATMNRVRGFSPTLRFKRGEAGQEIPSVSRLGLFQYVDVPPGAEFDEMPHASDPATMDMLSIANGKTEAATIYASVLGASQSNTYSQTALLSQLGRIPLETVRAQTGRAIADAVEIAIEWIRTNKEPVSVRNYRSGALSDIDPRDIPEYINLDCNLDVALPQDKLQAATIAKTLLDAGIVSEEWVVEETLKYGQPKQMQKTVLKERIIKALIGMEVQKLLAMSQQQPGQVPGQEGGQVPGQEPGQEASQMQGIPPEMLEGGMGGPEMAMGEQQMMPEEGIGLA
jgi:hypothetical protein